MAKDIESSYWLSTPEEPSARFCNFSTGGSTLRPAHQDWLNRNVVPILRGQGGYIVEIGGLASRLGAAALNERLGQARADAVKAFLEQQVQMTLPNVLTASYGENVSGGAVDDNDGFWRAVLIKLHQGVVVLPDPPPQIRRPPSMPAPLPKMYFGLGVKFGGILIGGTQTLEGYLFSVDDYDDQVHVEARIWTLGPGLGGGGNVVFIMAYGGTDKRGFVGTKFDGWDFAVSLGGRWGDAVKGVSKIPAIAKLAEVVKDGGKAAAVLKGAAKLKPGEWEKVAELVKTSREALGVDADATKPQLSVFDIPLAGGALEVSLYKWWGTVTTFN
ncbi:OmpA family protein [Prosthecomicrobium sp. N25]|uniref:OmpA family protein n=1 Tax=Prosthecomicrobium sp. N25 TaxID=3129254 RepID=UPI00307878FD